MLRLHMRLDMVSVPRAEATLLTSPEPILVLQHELANKIIQA